MADETGGIVVDVVGVAGLMRRPEAPRQKGGDDGQTREQAHGPDPTQLRKQLRHLKGARGFVGAYPVGEQ